MGVLARYADSLLNSSSQLYRQGMPAIFQGLSLNVAYGEFAIVAGDDDNSIIHMWKDIPASAVPILMPIGTSGMTASTVWDIGIAYTGKLDGTIGATISQNALGNDVDLSSAIVLSASNFLNGLNNISVANRFKNLAQLAGYTTGSHPAAFDIPFKGVTIGSANGTVEGLFIYGMP